VAPSLDGVKAAVKAEAQPRQPTLVSPVLAGCVPGQLVLNFGDCPKRIWGAALIPFSPRPYFFVHESAVHIRMSRGWMARPQ
jgi:hypothetical protein